LSQARILLGFEVGSGNPVYMSKHHLVITGMTQLSGKTTALEALISRAGSELKAIAFKTKRGESGFKDFREIPPFFRERADWQYVESLLEATLRERMKFERSWIIKACRGTKTLRDVYQAVEELKAKARKDSLSESVYTNLAEYLKIVVPQIERIRFTRSLDLKPGINVMDLVDMSLEMRMLVIQSVMEYALDHLNDTVIIVPEAWEALPQSRGTPVKVYAETYIRKGASVGNYLWVDSQDLAGIDKTPLRQCDNWILGRQKEQHEVDRTKDSIFRNPPSDEEIRTLPIGHFYAALGNDVYKVYVKPSWLPEDVAKRVARGELEPDSEEVQAFKSHRVWHRASGVWEPAGPETVEEAQKEHDEFLLQGQVEDLERQLQRLEELARQVYG